MKYTLHQIAAMGDDMIKSLHYKNVLQLHGKMLIIIYFHVNIEQFAQNLPKMHKITMVKQNDMRRNFFVSARGIPGIR